MSKAPTATAKGKIRSPTCGNISYRLTTSAKAQKKSQSSRATGKATKINGIKQDKKGNASRDGTGTGNVQETDETIDEIDLGK